MTNIGIDLGSYYYLASKREETGNVEVLSNKLDKRLSLTFFAYSKNKKYHQGKSLISEDVNNAIVNGKDFFARKYNDEEFKILLENYYPYKLLKDEDNLPYFEVKFKNENIKYTYKDIYNAYFNEIEETIAYKKLEGENISNQKWIISYPPYYTSIQRKALKTLCNFRHCNDIIKCKDIVSETVAYALCYGYENNVKYADKSEVLLLVDIGYSCASVTCVKYENNKCTILGNAYNREICGRNIDKLIVDYVKKDIQESDVFKDSYETISVDRICNLKILQTMISVKEVLSIENSYSIFIYHLYNDKDYELTFSRDDFNSVLKNNKYDERIESLLDECVKKCNIKANDIDGIVIAGGTCRISFIQNTLLKYMNKKMEKTCRLDKSINMEEHIACGCSYYGLLMNDIWKYELINNDEDELLLSSYNDITKKRIIKMDNYLSRFLSGFSDTNIEENDKELIYEYFKDEIKLIESMIEKTNDGLDDEKEMEEANKVKNDMERDIFALHHDLSLIQNKMLIENENNYLWEILEDLHNDNNLNSLNSIKEYESNFCQEWEEKKKTKFHLAILLCKLSIVVYPKQKEEYEKQILELNKVDTKKLLMSKCITICSSITNKQNEIINKLRMMINNYILVLLSSPRNFAESSKKYIYKLKEMMKLINVEPSLDNLNMFYSQSYIMTQMIEKYKTAIIKSLNEKYEKCEFFGNIIVDFSEVLESIEALRNYVNDDKIEKSSDNLKYLFNEFIKVNDSYQSKKNDVIYKLEEKKQSILNEIAQITLDMPKEIEVLKHKVECIQTKETIDLAECKKNYIQLSGCYSDTIESIDNEIIEKKKVLISELDNCMIKEIKESYLDAIKVIESKSNVIESYNNIKLLNDLEINYFEEMTKIMNELIKEIKDNVKEIEIVDNNILNETNVNIKDINLRIKLLMDLENKYKHKYIVKIEELRKILNEVEENDEKVICIINESNKTLKELNEMKLIGVIVIYTRLYDEVERQNRMNNEYVMKYIEKYQTLYDKVNENIALFISFYSFILTFKAFLQNRFSIRVKAFCKTVEIEYIKVIDKMKIKILEKNPYYHDIIQEEVVDTFFNPSLYDPELQTENDDNLPVECDI